MTGPGTRRAAVVMTVGVLVTLALGVLGAFGWLWWIWSDTPNEVRAAISPARRATVVGVGAVTLLAFVGGFAFTVVGLVRSFDAAGRAAPSDKARMLAEGISNAMNGTAFGIVALGAGALLALVAGFRLLRASARVRA